jgi:hypothetical protein
MDAKERDEFKKNTNSSVDIQRLNKHDLKLVLAYLWPHENGHEVDINQFVEDFSNNKESQIDLQVDKEAFNYLRSGLHGLA